MRSAKRRVALVGGGHAHVEVIRRWARRPPPDAQLTVISNCPRPVYSGMVPGYVAGQYSVADLELDLPALCKRAQARLVLATVARVDAPGRRIRTEDGEVIAFDVASLDIGSTVAGAELPGVELHALMARPIGELVYGVSRLAAEAARLAAPPRIAVVGAGAGGVELAFCLCERLRRSSGRSPWMALVESGSRILPGASAPLIKRTEHILCERGVRVLLERRVAGLDGSALFFEDGSKIEVDSVVWVAGPAAHRLPADSGLPVDRAGFVRIRPSLQVEGYPGLFAVGDCASLSGMKKAGVYAVRAAPVLSHNLGAFLRGADLREFRPQSDFLTLLNTGNGTALGAKWGVSFEGPWVMRLKDFIDRRFMERYR